MDTVVDIEAPRRTRARATESIGTIIPVGMATAVTLRMEEMEEMVEDMEGRPDHLSIRHQRQLRVMTTHRATLITTVMAVETAMETLGLVTRQVHDLPNILVRTHMAMVEEEEQVTAGGISDAVKGAL